MPTPRNPQVFELEICDRVVSDSGLAQHSPRQLKLG